MSNIKSLTRIAAIGTALAAGLLAMTPGLALAQSGSWQTTGGGSWPTSGNWNTLADGSGNTATFNRSIPNATFFTVTLDGARTIGNLNFTNSTAGTGSTGAWVLAPGSGGPLTLAVSSGTSTITVGSNSFGTVTSVIAGSQGLRKAGSGTLFLSGTNTYTGVTEIPSGAGTVDITTTEGFGATGPGNHTLLTGGRARIGWNGITNEEFVINASNSNGAISFASSQSGVVVSSTVAGQVTFNATARIDVGTDCVGTFASGDGISLNLQTNTGTFAGSGILYVQRPIVGTGGASVIQNGGAASRLVLTAANTYSGSTAIMNNGRIELGDGNAGGSIANSTELYMHTTSAAFVVNQSDTVTQGVDFPAITSSGAPNVGNFTQQGSGTTIFTVANGYRGTTTVSAGALQLGNAGTTGGLNANSAISIAAGATLRVNRTNTANQGTDFSTAAITGAGGFTQAGSGTTTLNAANSYTGTTLVNAGTLLINGDQSAAIGAVTVAAGATLGGSGTIGGNTTIAGIHSPGNSPGAQTFNGDLTYQAGAVVNWELIANSTGSPGTNYDQIVVPTGNLTFSGSTTLALSFNGAGSAVDWSNTFWSVNRSWTVYDLSAGAVSNAGNLVLGGSLFDSLGNSLSPTGRGYFTTSVSGQDVMLNFVAVPEPSTLVLLSGLAVGCFLLRRRRA